MTNTGAAPQVVAARGRDFGPDTNVQTRHRHAERRDEPAVRRTTRASQNNYAVFHFKVPAGENRLVAIDYYPGNPANGQ